MSIRHIFIIGAALMASVGASADEGAFADATKEFLGALDEVERAMVVRAFNSELRLDWHFIPRAREGLAIKQMNENQVQLLLKVLGAGMSARGLSQAETIRQLELVLREIEGRDARDPDQYFVLVFGEPSDEDAWGLRYEGHHLSLSWTYVEGKLAASSPQFLGTNPAEVRIEGKMKGTRVLSAEEDLGRSLVASLDGDQRTIAVVGEKAPRDIFTAAQHEAARQDDVGIRYGQLNVRQQGLVISIIAQFAGVQADAEAGRRLAAVREAGLDDIQFAWMGSIEKGEAHYYRIQGPTFLIEYDNIQNDANHIHAVWRDFKGDFGMDVLKRHYALHVH